MKIKKILTSKELLNLSRTTPIVFVSGTFDLLHIGHIKFLREAKNYANSQNAKLLVTLHDDSSIKLVKGPDRPYTQQEDRAEQISELESVDLVVVWSGWETIIEFAKKIKPVAFALTKKNFEYSHSGQWTFSSWYDVAKTTNSKVIEIDVYKNFASSSLLKTIE